MLPGVDFNAIKLATVSFAKTMSPIGMVAVAAGTVVAAVALNVLRKDLGALITKIKATEFKKPTFSGVVQAVKDGAASIRKTALNVSVLAAGAFLAYSFAKK